MMNKNKMIRLIAAGACVAASAAVAGKSMDEGGFTPHFTDAAIYTYVEAEADYADEAGGQLRWDIESWVGGDYQKLWLRTDGERHDGEVEHAELQLLYGRYLAPFWDWRLGLRHDIEPTSRSYAVLGLKGLAPYRFETDASVYVSEEGDLSLELETELDLLVTQRLIAQPYLELGLFAQEVPELVRGSGLSEASAGLRVCYEIIRQIAPYIDFGYERLFGGTADLAGRAGQEREEFLARVGLSVWY